MFRFANYVFGNEVESNSDNENIDINQCTEQDIDDDWILIDVSSGDDQKPTTVKKLSNSANLETTTNTVPQNLNTKDAQEVDEKSDDSDMDSLEPCEATATNRTNGGHSMEESWFVTPPPCFNSLSHPINIEPNPLENLLIEHPSMSVFGPSLPPIDHRSSHRSSDSSAITASIRSSDETAVSTQPLSRRQLRQMRRQQQNAIQNRNDNQSVNLHLRSVVLDELKVLNEMQTQEVSTKKKVLTKSSMDRQNKVVVQRNRPQNRRTKMAVRPNGIYNNRNKC